MTLTEEGFAVFKTGTLYKTWLRDNPGEAAKVDACLAGEPPQPVASYTGKGLMLFAQAKDGFPQMFQGTLWKKWSEDNPGETSKLLAYRNGTGPRPSLATATGKGFVFFVDAYKNIEPDPLWKKDLVYTTNLSAWDGPRRTAAWNQGFRVVAVLADEVADPAAAANLNELALIGNSLRTQGWSIVGWAANYNDPEQGVFRARNLIQQYGFDGWIVNGESWWEGQFTYLGDRFISAWNSEGIGKPLALSCLSSTTPNYARDFNFAPWVQSRISIQPQVYGNADPGYTVYNCIETMKKSSVPLSLLNLTLGVYYAGMPIPWDDYRTWAGSRSIYIGERLDAGDYVNLAR